MLDVNAGRPGHYLNRDTPWITYNKEYVTNVFTTMTVFSGYSNGGFTFSVVIRVNLTFLVIGYFIGNELINAKTSAMTSPPYLKALVRDMKAYSLAHLDGPVTVCLFITARSQRSSELTTPLDWVLCGRQYRFPSRDCDLHVLRYRCGR